MGFKSVESILTKKVKTRKYKQPKLKRIAKTTGKGFLKMGKFLGERATIAAENYSMAEKKQGKRKKPKSFLDDFNMI